MRSSVTSIFLPSLLLAISACSPTPPPAQSKPKRAEPAHLVERVLVSRDPLRATHVRTGTLRARRTVRIFNQEEGRITRMPFYEGDPVARYDVLTELDDELLRAQLDKAAATLRQAEIDLKRVHGLIGKRLTSEDEVARAQTALDVARAEEKVLRTRLGYTKIRAPFTGVVSARLVEPGDVVPRHTHIMSLTDPNSLVTELSVSELLIPYLQKGDAVEVRIDALGEQVFSGRILRIHPTLDPRTRRGLVEVELDPVPDNARAGQFCRVTLRTPALERLTIPFRALRRDAQGEYVFSIDESNIARPTPVRSGLRIAERVEILEGLTQGQSVIVKGFLGLRNGKKVKLVNVYTSRGLK